MHGGGLDTEVDSNVKNVVVYEGPVLVLEDQCTILETKCDDYSCDSGCESLVIQVSLNCSLSVLGKRWH
jgi:hypothetical protein